MGEALLLTCGASLEVSEGHCASTAASSSLSVHAARSQLLPMQDRSRLLLHDYVFCSRRRPFASDMLICEPVVDRGQ